MADQFRALGCGAEIDRAGNVVASAPARWRRAAGGSHGASRYRAGAAHQGEITVDGDGKLLGPGVSDNGGGLAASGDRPRRAHRASDSEAAARLVLVANVGEEGEGNLNGMRHLACQSPLAARIRAYLVLDGPSLDASPTRPLRPPLRGAVQRRGRPQLERLRQRQPGPRAEPRHRLVHGSIPARRAPANRDALVIRSAAPVEGGSRRRRTRFRRRPAARWTCAPRTARRSTNWPTRSPPPSTARCNRRTSAPPAPSSRRA